MTLLYWDPDVVCPLTNPTVYNIGTTTNIDINLAANEHAILSYPTNAISNGYVRVFGVPGSDNRVRAIGGSARHAAEFDSGVDFSLPDGSKSHCLRLQDIKIGYIEGMKFDKANFSGDCISWTARTNNNPNNPAGKLYVQHCHGTQIMYKDVTLFGHDITQHGDFVQVTRQAEFVGMDFNTFYTWRQGWVINSNLQNQYVPGPALLLGGMFRRTNGHVYDTTTYPVSPPAPRSHMFRFQDDCSMLPIPYFLEDVYIIDDEAVTPSPVDNTVDKMVDPSTFYANPASCAAILDVGDNSVTFPIATQIIGKVKYGLPPGGDYVPTSFTGLNYVTPGYRQTPSAEEFFEGVMGIPLPSIAGVKNLTDLTNRLNGLIRTLEMRFAARERVGNATGYSTTNVITTRTMDADTVTTAQLADVVGTLIADLQRAGVIR